MRLDTVDPTAGETARVAAEARADAYRVQDPTNPSCGDLTAQGGPRGVDEMIVDPTDPDCGRQRA